MSARITPPKGLGRAGRDLYRRVVGDVPAGVVLDAVELDTLARAARLADRAAQIDADLNAKGVWTVGAAGQERLSSAVGELRQLENTISVMLKRVDLEPPVRTRSLNRAQRNMLRDAAAGRR